MPVRWLEGMPSDDGVKDLVIAWTLEIAMISKYMMPLPQQLLGCIPVKRAGKNE